AEDGIRDPLVTGVQTCALPISSSSSPSLSSSSSSSKNIKEDSFLNSPPIFWCEVYFEVHKKWFCVDPIRFTVNVPRSMEPAANRSEERRVGIGCRCCWCVVDGY